MSNPKTISQLRMRLFCLLAMLFFVVNGCGPSKPTLPPLGEDAVVLAFGDSLTYGTGALENESYPAVLAALIHRKVVNLGIPGETSAQGLLRLPDVLDEVKPDLLLLCSGGNDLLQKLDPAQTKANLKEMIQLAKERYIAVVLIAVPEPNLSVRPPAYYRELADEYKLPIEEEILPKVLGKRSLKSDYIHPNAGGYQLIAEAIAKLLKKHGAIK